MDRLFNPLNYSFIIIYMIIMVVVAFIMQKYAEKNTNNYFVGGREIPWWAAGISMVATTFAADTPLAVTGIVAANGIAGNWVWWNFMFSGIFTVFLYAKLWHRAGVTTDAEFITLRYGGPIAKFLRAFRALYLALPINCIILGWVTLGMTKLLGVITGSDPWTIIIYLYILTTIYIAVSGIWGIVVTDFLQFFIAMGGSIILMFHAVNHEKIGGFRNLLNVLQDKFKDNPDMLNISPFGNTEIIISTVLVWIGMQWWAAWYPGAEPGGGGYVAQRIFSTKTDKDAVKASLLFNIFHYAIRPWPWIIVALIAFIIYPESRELAEKDGQWIKANSSELIIHYNGDESETVLTANEITNKPTWGIPPIHKSPNSNIKKGDSLFDAEKGYPTIMKLLPDGLFGLLVVAFLSAFMSTLSTHLNWGASYIVNDFYKLYIKPENEFDKPEIAEKHYMIISKLSTILMMFCAIGVSLLFDSVKHGWEFILSLGAGTGLVYLLRWYWWRINAWSEISAMTAAMISSIVAQVGGMDFAYTMIYTTVVTTMVWLLVTLLTQPESKETLKTFYNKVQPAGPGWSIFEKQSDESLKGPFINIIMAIIVIQSFLFGTGQLILGSFVFGLCLIITGLITGYLLVKRIN